MAARRPVNKKQTRRKAGHGLPKVGDVITSPMFAFGYRDDEGDTVIVIDGQTYTDEDEEDLAVDVDEFAEKHRVTESIDEEERVRTAAKTGKIPPKTRTVDLGAYDIGRGSAKFVVEEAKMEGGGTGHGPHDVYPDGWHITARRLKKDGSYNPRGQIIEFYMTGSFTCMVEAKDIQVVGHMKPSKLSFT